MRNEPLDLEKPPQTANLANIYISMGLARVVEKNPGSSGSDRLRITGGVLLRITGGVLLSLSAKRLIPCID